MTTGTTASRNFESGNVISRTAGGAIPAYSMVKLDSTEGQVVVTAATTDIAIGVALNTAASGEEVQVQTAGVAPVLVSAAIALAAEVMPNSSGNVTTATGAVRVCGIAESATDTAGQLARIRLCCPSLKALAQS
jgi:hypothetical protein